MCPRAAVPKAFAARAALHVDTHGLGCVQTEGAVVLGHARRRRPAAGGLGGPWCDGCLSDWPVVA